MRARQTFLHKSEWAAEIAALKERGCKHIQSSQDPVQDYVSRLWHTEYVVSYDVPEPQGGGNDDAIQPTDDGTPVSTVGHA